jgi:hypothetical protein
MHAEHFSPMFDYCFSRQVHGTIGSCFLFGCHELGHGTVFRTKWLNRVFLFIFSTLSWWDPYDYAISHTFHHKYTQFAEADRENVLPIDPSLPWSVLIEWFTVNLTAVPGNVFGKGGLVSHVHLFCRAALGLPPGPPAGCPQNEWLISLHEDSPEEHMRSIWWSRFMLVFHATVIAVSVSRGLWILPFIICFHSFIGACALYSSHVLQLHRSLSLCIVIAHEEPHAHHMRARTRTRTRTRTRARAHTHTHTHHTTHLLSHNPGNWMRNFWGMTQHCGLRGDVPDFRKSTRTIKLGSTSQFFHWHMNYHIVSVIPSHLHSLTPPQLRATFGRPTAFLAKCLISDMRATSSYNGIFPLCY